MRGTSRHACKCPSDFDCKIIQPSSKLRKLLKISSMLMGFCNTGPVVAKSQGDSVGIYGRNEKLDQHNNLNVNSRPWTLSRFMDISGIIGAIHLFFFPT